MTDHSPPDADGCTPLPRDQWRYFIFSDTEDCLLAVVCSVNRDGLEVYPTLFSLRDLPNDFVTDVDLVRLGFGLMSKDASSIFQIELCPML
ncbi:hypothetical protein X745_04160 [Mesorhizobium sp. LNJC374B00]|nr:hypothetical protein X745_04160 [Mesorhizobium sp. LNJC374B00]